MPPTQPHTDHQFTLKCPAHIHPSSEYSHQALNYSAQESLPHFPEKAGPFPQEAADKAQNPSKSMFLFNEAAHCSANSLVFSSSFQEAGDMPNTPDLMPTTQTWQKHFF